LIVIRPYISSDLGALTELMTVLGTPSTLEDMEKRMSLIESTNNYYTFVAMMSGVVVGMIGIRMQLSYVSDYLKTQVSALVTKEEYQGKGVGRALLEHVEQWVQEKGSNFLYLTSGIKDERLGAHEFYKKMGFEITGYRFVKKLSP
jgi:GNAT superfamily N-acetyltransferase